MPPPAPPPPKVIIITFFKFFFEAFPNRNSIFEIFAILLHFTHGWVVRQIGHRKIHER